ncbi:hypothetical protein BN7_3703 [Wickerhamomyces ciferrii]|uniref:Uncharacterized protein n=1 Tax=Wickerhamomyces ciferrii (strain ATCC 14091 / BCRC 22168 / CBS 111 / JCM 3599 / NBRC 0793 / NRRL Y-1031 F-60-10) TaxID=1206466 RepID=K0KG61_WICCF|nr:uncharacterized protein BN7_3703 [Wickerhamomyces ciferrii]CCH44145.1 hypothetical protein BN7_3703 [Wickerhamomyces ciferrii]
MRAIPSPSPPLYLNTKLELAAFTLCGSALVDYEGINVRLSYDSQSFTIYYGHPGHMGSVKAVMIDDRYDKILLSSYYKPHVQFSDVFEFKDVFGDVQFPVRFSDAIANPMSVLPFQDTTLLKMRTTFYNTKFHSSEPGATGMKHIYEHDHFPDNYAPPKQFKDEQRKRYIATACFNGFKKSAKNGILRQQEEAYNSDDDEEKNDKSVSIPESTNNPYTPVEYPGIPFGGQSSFLIGLNSQNPFTRAS